MGVIRIVDVGSRVRRAGCMLGVRRASVMGVGRNVEVDSSDRRAGFRSVCG